MKCVLTKKSGLSFFYIDEGTDSGDILWQKSFKITLEDDAHSVYEKIEKLASKAIEEFLPQLETGAAPRIPQDHSQATYWRKRIEKDGEINWGSSTIEAYNLIRALTCPYVGAHTFINGRKMIIWRSKIPKDLLPDEAKRLNSGTIFSKDNGTFTVRTGDSYLTVLNYEMQGEDISIGAQLGGRV